MLCLALTIFLVTGCTHQTATSTAPAPQRQRGPLMAAPMRVLPAQQGSVNGQDVDIHRLQGMYAGYFIPDDQGGLVWVGSGDLLRLPDLSLEDVREFTLKINGLADQLLSGFGGSPKDKTTGTVVMVSPFVPLDPSVPPSSLGRFITVQLQNECAKRGFLALEKSSLEPGGVQGVLPSHRIVGTYHRDASTLTLSGQVVRTRTGTILAGGKETMGLTPFIRSLLAAGPSRLSPTPIPIRSPLAP